MASGQQAAKQRLRARLLAARGERSQADLSAAGEAISGVVMAQWPDVQTVALYVAMGTEPPTAPLVTAFSQAGAQVLLPVIDGDDLDWAHYDGSTHLARGPLGISEPTGRRLGPAAISAADLVVVPALAIDRGGHRLGRGRGYYDRALGTVTAPIAAVVFDSEVLDAIPTEPHDERVNAAVTPTGVIDLDPTT